MSKENGTSSSSGSGSGSSAGGGQTSANTSSNEAHQYVGPYRLEKTLGKGQTGRKYILILMATHYHIIYGSRSFSHSYHVFSPFPFSTILFNAIAFKVHGKKLSSWRYYRFFFSSCREKTQKTAESPEIVAESRIKWDKTI